MEGHVYILQEAMLTRRGSGAHLVDRRQQVGAADEVKERVKDPVAVHRGGDTIDDHSFCKGVGVEQALQQEEKFEVIV